MCPDDEICQTCPCSYEDDACFPDERLRAEIEQLRKVATEASEAMRLYNRDGLSWLKLDAAFARLDAVLAVSGTERGHDTRLMPDNHCDRPPAGWACTRSAGHDGPCAAVPEGSPDSRERDVLVDFAAYLKVPTPWAATVDAFLVEYDGVSSPPQGGEARNYEAADQMAYLPKSVGDYLVAQGWARLDRNSGVYYIARVDAVRHSPQGEDHELRERIADELSHNDECGSRHLASRAEYLADADAILRIVGERSPKDEAGRRRYPMILTGEAATAARHAEHDSPQGEDHEAAREGQHAFETRMHGPSPVSGTEPDTARECEAYENGSHDRTRAIVAFLRDTSPESFKGEAEWAARKIEAEYGDPPDNGYKFRSRPA